MFVIKPKNKFEEKIIERACEDLASLSQNIFIGDEMLVVNKSMHFFEDEVFMNVLNETAKAPIYQQMAWRMHNLVWAAKQALHIDGDFIECGVFRGFKSYFLLKYLTSELQKRRFFCVTPSMGSILN